MFPWPYYVKFSLLELSCVFYVEDEAREELDHAPGGSSPPPGVHFEEDELRVSSFRVW